MNTKGIFSKESDEWTTPKDLFYKLHHQYHFTLDPCCTNENALCLKHYTKAENGLLQSWKNETVFCNPPYSEVKKWVKKASEEKADTIMLIPARTDTKWFHEFIYQNPNVTILFLKGRLKFGDAKNSAPFPSMLVGFWNKEEYEL